MCVILFCTDARPKKETLERCHSRNPHGIGVAYFEEIEGKNKVRVRKGLTIEELTELVPTLPFPFTIHFRYKTVGDVEAEFCHPFPITAKAETFTDYTADKVIFHNGTFEDWNHYLMHLSCKDPKKYKLPPGKWSDSRALAWFVYHLGSNFLNLINNRFLIMDATASGRGRVKRYSQWWRYEKRIVTGEDSSEMEDGVLFSNDYWTRSGK